MPKLNNMDVSSELAQAIWTFNFRPDTYIHPSWLDNMPEGVVMRRLFGHQRGEGQLVLYTLQRLGLYESVFFDFSKPLSRLALWPGAELEQLILYLGAVFEVKTLRLIVSRDDLVKIQQILGEALNRFLHQRAGQISHNILESIELPTELGFKKRLIVIGMLCLRAAFIRYPPAFWRRLTFKLEREWYLAWKRYMTLGQSLDEQSAECAILVQKVAIEIKMGVSRDGKILFN